MIPEKHADINNRNLILCYFLVSLVLIHEVTVFFSSQNFPIPRMTSLILFLGLSAIFFLKGKKFDEKIIIVILLLLSLIFLQGMFFGLSIVTLFTYPLFVLMIPFFLYKIVGYKIFNYIVNIILYTAIISSAIWLLQNLIPPFDSYLQSLRFSNSPFIQGTETYSRVSLFFIYTIQGSPMEVFGINIHRNPGLYHEPGAFAYFLIFAIGLNTIIQNSFWNKTNIILSLILITTFSTAGYLALFVLLIFAALRSKIGINSKALILLLLVSIISISFISIDFMGQKILAHYETQIEQDMVEPTTAGRILRIRRAINLFSTSPIIGRGIITEARDFQPGSPYYFTGVGAWRTLSSYGIFFAGLIYLLFYRGIKNLCILYNFNQRFAIYFFIAILIGASSQRFFLDNISILLFVFGLLYSKQKIVNSMGSGILTASSTWFLKSQKSTARTARTGSFCPPRN